MALDTRIPLAARPADLSRLPADFNVTRRTNLMAEEAPYRNALLDAQREAQETSTRVAERGLQRDDQAQQAKRAVLVNAAAKNWLTLQGEQRRMSVEAFDEYMTNMGLQDPDDSSLDDPWMDDAYLQSVISATEPMIAAQTMSNRKPLQKGASVTAVDGSGRQLMGFPQFDPGSGATTMSWTDMGTGVPVTPAGGITITDEGGLTPDQQVGQKAREAGAAARATNMETRNSALATEMSTRNRNAARDGRRLREALQLSSQAGEGLTAAAKVKLSKIFPSIDASDEAALDATMTQLALDQLQNFKGPTTDFEYGVTQSIAGTYTDPIASRTARLKALERAAWFNQREFEQYRRHRNTGGNADNFRFNFGEQVNTKKGAFTLQDLQDTAVEYNISIDDVLQRLNSGSN